MFWNVLNLLLMVHYVISDCTFQHLQNVQVPMYYVTLTNESERARYMKDRVAEFAQSWNLTEVTLSPKEYPAMTVHDAAKLVAERWPGRQLVTSPSMMTPIPSAFKNPKKRYLTLGEVACSLSHIGAIRKAFYAGEELLLVTEDDVSFERFDESLFAATVAALKTAWFSRQPIVIQLYALGEVELTKAVSGLPKRRLVHGTGYGTQAYLINRQCMQNILRFVERGDDNLTKIFESDILLYRHCYGYLYSRPFVTHHFVGVMSSTLHDNKSGDDAHYKVALRAERDFRRLYFKDSGISPVPDDKPALWWRQARAIAMKRFPSTFCMSATCRNLLVQMVDKALSCLEKVNTTTRIQKA